MERVEWPIVKNATGMPFSDPRYSPTNRTSAICRAKETLPFIQRTFIGVSLTGPEFVRRSKEMAERNVKASHRLELRIFEIGSPIVHPKGPIGKDEAGCMQGRPLTNSSRL